MNVFVGFVALVFWVGVAWGQGADGADDAPLPAGPIAGKRPMTFADLQAMRRVSDPQISASGRWVMFSVTEASLEKNSKVNHLWVAPLGGGSGADLSPHRGPQAGSGQGRAAAARETAGGREVQVTFWKEGETGGRFSPDGRQVLFLSADAGTGVTQILLAPWDDATGKMGTPKRLTQLSTDADGAVWSPDGSRILFAARVYPECSSEDTWLHEDACNRRKVDEAAKSPVKAMVWDKLLYRHWNSYVGETRSHVLVVSARDGNDVRDVTPRRLVGDAEVPTFSLGGPMGYAWAPDGREIAYVTNLDAVPAASTNNDVWTLRLDDAGARPVRVSTSPGSDDGPAYSPDGRYLAFRSQARARYESDRFRLMLFDRGLKTTREVLPKFDRWVDEFAWGPDSNTIYIAGAVEGEAPVFQMNLQQRYLAQITDRGEFGSLVVTPDGRGVVATRMTAEQPAELAMVDLRTDAPTVDAVLTPPKRGESVPPPLSGAAYGYMKVVPVTAMNERTMAALELRPMERFWFAGAENTRVQGFLIRPPGFDPRRRYPVKFLIHGGPQGAWGDAWSYRWNPELFAADGYVVVMVNPRGSTGYGQAFVDGVNGDWGGKAYVDLMRGLDAAEAQFPFLDKGRECALGGSYGGFMANWILTHPDPKRPNRFACIVTHDGMYNPAAAYGDTEEVWFNEWEFRRPGANEPGQPWRYANGPASDDPFRRWSPMLSIQNAKTPTLVIHSQRDYRLDVSEGFQLFTALQRLGVPSRMLYFPDEGHWVLKPKNSELWYRTVDDWCDRWTHTGTYAGTR